MTAKTGSLYTGQYLSQKGVEYLTLLQYAGQADNAIVEEKVPDLFSPLCKKIVNGETKLTTREQFLPYFKEAQQAFGRWNVDQNYTLNPSPSTRSVTLVYNVETAQIKLLVIAILKINQDDGKIREIFEVDHKV